MSRTSDTTRRFKRGLRTLAVKTETAIPSCRPRGAVVIAVRSGAVPAGAGPGGTNGPPRKSDTSGAVLPGTMTAAAWSARTSAAAPVTVISAEAAASPTAAMAAQFAVLNPMLAQLVLSSPPSPTPPGTPSAAHPARMTELVPAPALLPAAPADSTPGAAAAGSMSSTPLQVFTDPIAQLSAFSPLAALAAENPVAALAALSPALATVNPAINPAATLLAFNPAAAPALAVTSPGLAAGGPTAFQAGLGLPFVW